MTPTEASSRLTSIANDLKISRGINIGPAMILAKQLNPQLAKALEGGRAGLEVTFINADGEAPYHGTQVEIANAASLNARESISRRARDLQFNNRNLSHLSALRVICGVNLALAKEAGLNTEAALVQFANSTDFGAYVPTAQVPPPGQLPETPKTLGGLDGAELVSYFLPYDASEDELAAAKSCGSKDPAKLFDCMVAWVARTRNVTPIASQAYCMGRFPRMASAAKFKSPLMSSSQGSSRTV